MEEVAGNQLDEDWQQTDLNDELKIVKEIVTIEKNHSSLSFA